MNLKQFDKIVTDQLSRSELVLMGKGNIQLLLPTDADALYHVNERPAV